MEDTESFQNGQESKEIYVEGESPFSGSTGREKEFYRSNYKGFTDPSKYTANSNKPKYYTEHQNDSARVEMASASMKLDKLFNSALGNAYVPTVNKFDSRFSDPKKYDQPPNQEPKEYAKLGNPSVESRKRATPSATNLNECVHLSSVKVEFSDEGEHQSSMQANLHSSGWSITNKFNSSIKADTKSQNDKRASFGTANKTNRNVSKLYINYYLLFKPEIFLI
jgi:hypothetical protein